MSLVLSSIGVAFMVPSVVSILGTSRFMFLYFGGGIAGNVLHASMPLLTNGRVSDSRNFGSIGPLTSLFAWFAFTYPTLTVQIFGIVPVPAGLLGLAYTGHEFYKLMHYGVQSDSGSSIGTALYGVIFSILTRRF
eukprot:CAMPEP_0171452772 /NCGR_PEP_ID=MMETSP0945-20130129/745_1 /TAXON_ID=109269 /ORGANISM="Vaucheria litorea, Strain CCMP2940" /LENGTH=134 /DNA_ID=CAMNT_0011977503 /DNA_START=435 /DNA_END=839 /DNA_ORIENTATION=+